MLRLELYLLLLFDILRLLNWPSIRSPHLLNSVGAVPFVARLSPVAMLIQPGRSPLRPFDPPSFALESSSATAQCLGTAPSSSDPPAGLAPPDYALPATIPQTSHDFSLPLRGRHEAQSENRRVSVAAALGNLFATTSNLAAPESASWHSQEGYQQAIAQFHARPRPSQPLGPGLGTGSSDQQQQQQPPPPPPSSPPEAPVSMRYVEFSVTMASPTKKHKAPSPQFYHLLRRISDKPTIFSHLPFTRGI